LTPLPSLFVSHGAPTIVLESSPAHEFLSGLGPTLGKPDAVVAVSAHWETERPAVTAAGRPATIHDFYGFPAPLYEIGYPAPGAPDLAARVIAYLEEAGLEAAADPERGLDHGAWVPLMLMYPEADVPVVQLSLQTARGPEHHLGLGRALRRLRSEGVLVMGSGGATHNLRELRPGGGPPPAWVSEFAGWLADTLTAGREAQALRYRELAPHGARNHPSEEHLLPLFAAMGAAHPDAGARRLHASYSYGVLAMDAYSFGTDGGAERAGGSRASR